MPELDQSLKHFMLDIQGGVGGDYITNHLEASGSIPSFEEVSTFADVTKRFGAETLLAAFFALIGAETPSEQGQSAWKLIEFFGAVESQALDQYTNCLQARMG